MYNPAVDKTIPGKLSVHVRVHICVHICIPARRVRRSIEETVVVSSSCVHQRDIAKIYSMNKTILTQMNFPFE